jgi:HSP20 family molecular chaperone IbpA
MAAMRAVGDGHRLPVGATLEEHAHEYVVRLDVSEFAPDEVSVEALGPRLTVRGTQLGSAEDLQRPFRLQERLEESFVLPDDADPAGTRVFYKHGRLEIRTPRTELEPRQLPVERPPLRIDPDAGGC